MTSAPASHPAPRPASASPGLGRGHRQPAAGPCALRLRARRPRPSRHPRRRRTARTRPLSSPAHRLSPLHPLDMVPNPPRPTPRRLALRFRGPEHGAACALISSPRSPESPSFANVSAPIPSAYPLLSLHGWRLLWLAVGLIRWSLHASSRPLQVRSSMASLMASSSALRAASCPSLARYDEQKQAVEKCFTWAVLLLGAYGIYQYIAPPPWDCAWLEGLPGGYENLSFGHPTPFEIRVWSTSNSPGEVRNNYAGRT